MPELRKFMLVLGCLIVVLLAAFIYQKVHVSNVPSKDEIIKSFKDNTDKFLAIQKYAEETNGNFYASKNLMMKNKDEKEGIDDASIKENALFVIRKLKVRVIIESSSVLKFKYTFGVQQGIIYLKDNVIPSNLLECEKIMDHWYYYSVYSPD